MNTELIIVLVLLATAIAMFVMGRPRMDMVGLLMLTVLPFTGVLTMSEALAGFSDGNIVLIAALFVMGEGLVRTGVAKRLGDWLSVKAGSSEIRLLVMLMVVVCLLGSTMSSTAVTAIFIPVVLRIAQGTGIPPSRLMMPLSFAALISGMTTLVATTPNLVINSELVREGHAGFHFFSFTPFGVPILILGILYMCFASRWLTSRHSEEAAATNRPSVHDWIRDYKLADREYRVRVTGQSSVAGKTIAELNLRETSGASIVAIERSRGSRHAILKPTPTTELMPDDILLIDLFVRDAKIDALLKTLGLEEMPLSGAYFSDHSQEIGMAEVIIPANSDLIGKTVIDAQFRTKYALTVIGIRRGVEALERDLRNEALKLGDTLLLIGPWRSIRNLQSGSGGLVVLNLPSELDEVLPVSGKALHAVIALLLVVGLMISGLVPNVQAALLGCLLMGALGCVDLASAYRAIDWKTIILIVGMLPFSIALQRTGGVEMGADLLMKVIGGAGTHVVLGSLFLITAMLGLFISNTATAVLMAPVALAIAAELKASPYPFAMIVALAASTAFMTPISSPVNTLVVTPGKYTFGDFVKVGVPFALVVLIVSVVMVPWLLPLYPK